MYTIFETLHFHPLERKECGEAALIARGADTRPNVHPRQPGSQHGGDVFVQSTVVHIFISISMILYIQTRFSHSDPIQSYSQSSQLEVDCSIKCNISEVIFEQFVNIVEHE
ncbi:Hypothetical_protein [Hexamita inflata]|uniref:Hypothetical_protein n=1 Tax=Hexamita inflata TaxID=28002 RepID=A0AA86RI83_9EUKA|nr:Hypothetical protein HINF_LOCUS66484 [Hexamita inflata]